MIGKIVKKTSLSVVTYTYNDQDLAAGLLGEIGGWSVAPREVIVVDDGSRLKFDSPRISPEPRVIRLEPNQGPTGAKRAGLDAAGSRFVLSIDSDVRLPGNWAEACLRALGQGQVGMVSTRVLYDCGRDPAARYLRLSYSDSDRPGGTSFIPGPVFMFGKAAYQACGGLGPYQERIGEDSYLCAAMIRAGYRLLLLEGPAARQIRRLRRSTIVARGFAWQKKTFFEAARKGEPMDQVLLVFLATCARRPAFRQQSDPCLKYFDVLYALHGLMSLAGLYGAGPLAGVAARLFRDVSAHPGLEALLWADLSELGHAPLPGGDPVPGSRWISSFQGLVGPELCRMLEQECLADLVSGQAEPEHFSFYQGAGL